MHWAKAKKAETRRWAAVLLALLLLGPVLVFLLLDHAPPCAFHQLVGVPCPGCGLGRSLAALLRLDLGAALMAYPPLVLLGAIYLILLGGTVGALIGRRMSWHQSRLGAVFAIGSAIVIIGNWMIQIVQRGATR